MARISRAQMTEKNPTEWVQGSEKARRARKNVARQLDKLIIEGAITGSQEYVAKRVRSYGEAIASGDLSSQRAALMELAVAAATTAASIDLGGRPRRRAIG